MKERTRVFKDIDKIIYSVDKPLYSRGSGLNITAVMIWQDLKIRLKNDQHIKEVIKK